VFDAVRNVIFENFALDLFEGGNDGLQAFVNAWHDDPAYQEVRKIGEKYAKYRTFAVEGVSQ